MMLTHHHPNHTSAATDASKVSSIPQVFTGDSSTSVEDKRGSDGAEASLEAEEEVEVVKDADASSTKEAGSLKKKQAGLRPNVSAEHKVLGIRLAME